MEITCTTLKIMTAHVKRFDDVRDLVAHLETIGYLIVAANPTGPAPFYKAAEGVTVTALDYPSHDGVAYILNHTTRGGQRAHRIDFPTTVGSITFEHEMNAAGVPHVGM